VTRNPDFKGTPLLDVEYLTNNTKYTHVYYRPLLENGMWPIEL